MGAGVMALRAVLRNLRIDSAPSTSASDPGSCFDAVGWTERGIVTVMKIEMAVGIEHIWCRHKAFVRHFNKEVEKQHHCPARH